MEEGEHRCNVVKVGQRPLWKWQIQNFLTQILGLDIDLYLGRGELCQHSGYRQCLCVGTQKSIAGLWIQELPVNFGLINASKVHQPLPISPITTII